ncbi:MAG: RluA family pseudouridine synthase [Candidatus Curtissbacteria bacterium]|nr:RluA family pseudouridine synthase [Candidatus Curtissbacteria bacterium]
MDDLNIIFEDDFLLVLDKPAGLVVNRSETNKGPTLQDQMLKYLSSVLSKGSDPNIGGRSGIVHRLDRETSGLMLVAKTERAYANLQKQFKERKIKKEYLGLVHGLVDKDRGEIDASIGRVGSFGRFGVVAGGRESRTEFVVEDRYKISEEKFNELLYSSSERSESRSNMLDSSRLRSNSNLTRPRINYLKHHARDYTLFLLRPKTGRTHQIRVHLKSIGHAVVSDLIYAPAKLLKFDLNWCPRLFLHAKSLEFAHPATEKPIFFESDLPKDLKDAMLYLTLNDKTTND